MPPNVSASLFDTHHERLYRLARRLSRNADDARDLVQETFLRAARSAGSVPSGAAHEEAWLVRVLINICRDRWRQTANRARLDPLGTATQPLRAGRSGVGAHRAVAGLGRAGRLDAEAAGGPRDVRAGRGDDSGDCQHPGCDGRHRSLASFAGPSRDGEPDSRSERAGECEHAPSRPAVPARAEQCDPARSALPGAREDVPGRAPRGDES